jgi:hypothetical protein
MTLKTSETFVFMLDDEHVMTEKRSRNESIVYSLISPLEF